MYDADALDRRTRDRLQQYGIEVDRPARVSIHPDLCAPAPGDQARGGYSPQMDFVQLYAPLFDSVADPEDAFAHEYVHKYQVDTAVGEPDTAYHAAIDELEGLSNDYLDLLDGFEHTDVEAERELGLGRLTDADSLRCLGLAVAPDAIEQLHAMALEDYQDQDDRQGREQVVADFETAVDRYLEGHWDEIRSAVTPVMDRAAAIEDQGGTIGPEEEAVAFYAGIAIGGHIDDPDYIAAEKDEIRRPDRDYEDPEHQVAALEELIADHRRLREEGHTEDEAITAILGRIDD